MYTSAQTGRVGQGGVGNPENRVGNPQRLETLCNPLAWCLASDNNPRIRCGISNAGIAHTFAVFMVRGYEMARGGRQAAAAASTSTMPKFVDVPLSAEGRKAFLDWKWDHEMLICELQGLCDSGYRVGCSWSGESQSYTVSLTCRDSTSVNAGLCMTSFAKTLERAVALSLFKHAIVAEGNWLGVASATTEDFG